MAFYLAFALLTFLIGSVTGIYVLYHLSYLTLGVHLGIRFLNHQGKRHLKVRREPDQERIFAGESARVKLVLENTGRWPVFWVSYDEAISPRLHTPPSKQGVLSLRPGERTEVVYTLQGQRRGFYPLGPLEARLGDGLGLEEETLHFTSSQWLIVYPQILPLDELGLPSRIVFGDLIWPVRIYHDPLRLRGLREYQTGDSLRDIYWPATAEAGQLMVKEYDSTITVENLIVLNLNLQDYRLKRLEPRIELAVEAAASIAHYLIHCQQSVGLASNGADPLEGVQSVPAGRGADHLMKMLEVLARLEMAEDAPFLPVVEGYRHQATPGSTILLVTAADTDELIGEALDLCRQGLHVVIIVVGDQVLHPEYWNRAYTGNLVIYTLQRKEDLYAWGE